LGPIEREPVPNEPISNIRPANVADGHHAFIPIAVNFGALDGTPAYEVKKRIRRFLSTMVQVALFIAAKLIRFRRVNSEYANTRAMNFNCIAIDYGSLSD
jgi:hypothetical protein